ncbi:MAG: FAD-binding oxidoreductase [Rhizobiales bacterium]|nr:FAD-binding oxidoreductase [Hyphomicrobiales bacterium]
MNPSDDDLLSAVSRLVGPGGVLLAADDLARYGREWSGDNVGAPRLVVRPRTVEEVSAIVTFCAGHGVRMTPQGGHTGLVGGALPSPQGDEVVLSLELMNGVREFDQANFSITVEAGCVLEQVRNIAAEKGFVFPLALGSQGSCQIGGAVATNAGGLNVLRYGMMRDLVLGLEAVLPDGGIWRGLKKLRKDNTGYDLKQLLLGSEGTLGIVTAACLKLFPAPTQVETAFLALDSVSDVVSLFDAARRDLSDLLSAFELLTREGLDFSGRPDPLEKPARVYVLLEASASGILDLRSLLHAFLERATERGMIADGVVAASSAQAASFWRIREEIIEAQRRGGRHLRTDVSVPISAIPLFMDKATAAVASVSADATVLSYGHVGDGNLHFNVVPPRGLADAAAIDFLHRCELAIFAVVDAVNGSISAEHGVGRLKREAFLSRLSPVHADILRRIKREFDPAGVMNSGRVLEPLVR